MKQEQRRGLLYGSLAADSLSLGSHWVYNTNAIAKRLGRPDELTDPIVKSFHPNRKRGEFTHYGDQALWLLEHIARNGGYDGQAFFTYWLEQMGSYDGYLDHASEDTLKAERASGSDDLAGAGRTAALAFLYHDDRQQLAESAAEHAQLTHGDPLVADTARFFSLLLFEQDKPMDAALRSVLEAGGWKSDKLTEAVTRGLDSAGSDTTETIGEFGQMCTAYRALPGTVHLLATYPEDYREALVANTAAGGDSAARGLLVGMVLGGRLGVDAIPPEWIEPLAYRERIETAAEEIESLT